MDIDNILTVFIMIMFQRILNKLDEVEAFFCCIEDCQASQCDKWKYNVDQDAKS